MANLKTATKSNGDSHLSAVKKESRENEIAIFQEEAEPIRESQILSKVDLEIKYKVLNI